MQVIKNQQIMSLQWLPLDHKKREQMLSFNEADAEFWVVHESMTGPINGMGEDLNVRWNNQRFTISPEGYFCMTLDDNMKINGVFTLSKEMHDAMVIDTDQPLNQDEIEIAQCIQKMLKEVGIKEEELQTMAKGDKSNSEVYLSYNLAKIVKELLNKAHLPNG